MEEKKTAKNLLERIKVRTTGRFSSVHEAARQAVVAVYDLIRRLKIPTLKETGVSWENLEPLAARAYQNTGTSYNARELGETDFLELFRKAFNEESPF